MNKANKLPADLRLRRLATFGVTILFSTTILYWVVPVQAIVKCHDYAYYRLTCDTGKCEDRGDINVKTLRDKLKALKYVQYLIPDPSADTDGLHKNPIPGDVLILRDDHSGYVNSELTIDHFIQMLGRVGNPWAVDELRGLLHRKDGPPGGFYEKNSLEEFLTAPSYKGPWKTLEVWRKKAPVDPGPMSWIVTLNGKMFKKGDPARRLGLGSAACLTVEFNNIPEKRKWQLQIWREDSQGTKMLPETTEVTDTSAVLQQCISGPDKEDRTNYYGKIVEIGGGGWMVAPTYIDWIK